MPQEMYLHSANYADLHHEANVGNSSIEETSHYNHLVDSIATFALMVLNRALVFLSTVYHSVCVSCN